MLAAFAEIAGCFSFWVCLRTQHSALWLVPGMISLALFAWLLTLGDSSHAGRAYAAYAASTSRRRSCGCGLSRGRSQINGTCSEQALPGGSGGDRGRSAGNVTGTGQARA